MEMEDLLDVTQEMMAFLRGKRADLHVPTTVGGVQREFFNEREIAHMVDVRHLFLVAIAIRRICAVIILLSIALLWRTKADIKRLFASDALYRYCAVFCINCCPCDHNIHRLHEIFYTFPQNILYQ